MSGASGLRKHDHSSAGQGGTLAGGGSTLADVLTAGNDTTGLDIVSNPSGSTSPTTLEVGDFIFMGGSNFGAGVAGGYIEMAGGAGDGGTAYGADVIVEGGHSGGVGGSFTVVAGDAESGSNGDGGDVLLDAGTKDGSGRNGLLIVPGVPTADPSVSDAIWADGGTLVQSGFTAGGGGGSVATDAIFDAKGDLAAGTGADTAAKLTVGADDTILMADAAASTGLKWVASATPSTQAFGDSAATGTGDTFTRGDHKHAMPALGTTAAAIGTSAGGSATTPSKSDHVHATGAGTPSTQALGDSAATGSGPAAAMTDHKHAMPTAAVTTSGLTQATNKLLGRSTASTGAIEEITIGTNLSLSGGVLDASGGGGGSVGTDTIWDAAGDLAQGTGANTAAKLVLGAAAFGLVSTGSAAAWAEVLPWRIQLIPMMATPDASTGTWGLNNDTTSGNVYPFYQPGSAANSGGAVEYANTSTHAQNDAISYNVVLAAGTWSCHFWVRKTSVSAIITLNQDGSSEGTVDTYAAATAAAKVTIAGWTVATTGKHVMQIKAATKNASSSDYYLLLHGIEFQRTA